MPQRIFRTVPALIIILILPVLLSASAKLVSGTDEKKPVSIGNHPVESNAGISQENISKQEETPTEYPSNGAVILDVPYINQRRDYPNGCESVSAVMALQYLGIDITPDVFIGNHLDMGKAPYFQNGVRYGCDPYEQFPGDPRSSNGWGCYPQVIKKAVDSMGIEGMSAQVLKDAPLSTLCSAYIDKGIPVVFWATIDMRKPSSYITWYIEGTDRTHTWTNPFHCLLLVGYDSESYYFNDPWQSKAIAYPRSAVETAYASVGRHALVIFPEGQFPTA